MSNARETPSQRRAKEILEFVEAGQWKRGLQLCEKYQKKGDTSDTLKVELPSYTAQLFEADESLF